MLCYINSINLLPPQLPTRQDTALLHCMEKLRQNLMKSMAATPQTNTKLNLLTTQFGATVDDDDNDDDSQSLLSQDKITDFLRGA